MRTHPWFLILSLSFATFGADQAPPPDATAAPPPSAPAKRSAADLEKLVAPLALYPDPLIATMLPASVYPLEIVQAARFVADTNNLANLDDQPWDDSVKAVARVPDAIKKLNDDLSWTIELGEAFLEQDKDLMDAIQRMRGKAQKAGTLQTTEQQIIVVTNMVVERTVEQQVVVVTNTVVQIQPASSSVVYVPTYNPYAVYYPPPAYVYNPVAPLVTFTAGVAMGAIIANNCDWHGGGCYHGDVDININRNVNNTFNRNANVNTAGATSARASSTSAGKKWQPDQSRLSKSGAPSTSAAARNAESRGWGSSGAKPSTTAAPRPSTGIAAARPSTGTAQTRPSTGGASAAARPSLGTPSASRPTASQSQSRAGPSPSVSPTRPNPSAARPSSSSSGSAFGGSGSGAGARDYSSRGAASRSSGGGFGGGARGGGGGRGGGRR